MVTASVVQHIHGLRPYLDGWHRLAELRGQPYSMPAWMLAWWEFVAPKGSGLAVTVVRDGSEVLGLGAWYTHRRPSGLRIARLLGSGHRVEPLSVPGREREVADAMSEALRCADDPPGALLLDRADLRSRWPTLLNAAWGRPSNDVSRAATPAPTLTIGGRTYEQYLAGRSRNFRKERKQGLRKLGERGAFARLVGPQDDLDAAVGAFMRLHHARWDSLGAASGLGYGTEQMLRVAAHELVPKGRMRIWLLEAEGTPIAAEIHLTAGGETGCWSGGFDPTWCDLRPGFLTLQRAVQHAFDQGDHRVDLGGGAASYKFRLADADEPIASSIILAGGPGRALRATQLLPDRMGRAATRLAKDLPIPIQNRLRAVHGTMSSWAGRKSSRISSGRTPGPGVPADSAAR